MKKKKIISSKDKKDWTDFTKNIGELSPKEEDLIKNNFIQEKGRKLDLHGFSLNQANESVKKFIIESFNLGYKKVLIVTGKGSRSNSFKNPYISGKLGILKNSIPEFIENCTDLENKILKITKADAKEGGDGALSVILKKNDNL